MPPVFTMAENHYELELNQLCNDSGFELEINSLVPTHSLQHEDVETLYSVILEGVVLHSDIPPFLPFTSNLRANPKIPLTLPSIYTSNLTI